MLPKAALGGKGLELGVDAALDMEKVRLGEPVRIGTYYGHDVNDYARSRLTEYYLNNLGPGSMFCIGDTSFRAQDRHVIMMSNDYNTEFAATGLRSKGIYGTFGRNHEKVMATLGEQTTRIRHIYARDSLRNIDAFHQFFQMMTDPRLKIESGYIQGWFPLTWTDQVISYTSHTGVIHNKTSIKGWVEQTVTMDGQMGHVEMVPTYE